MTPRDEGCYSPAMKVLLTGGAGFIGSHVADALLAAGHEVVIVDDLSSGSPANLPPAARFYLLDICSRELAKVFQIEKPDVVDHHAAQISVPVSVRDPVRDARVNAMGLLNVLECCRQSKVRKVIFISSGGAIYGEAGGRRLREDHPALPLSPYAIHKQLGESYLRFYAATFGLASTALRYANVYGPRQNPEGEAGVVAIFISRLLRGEVPVVNAYPEDPEGMSRDYVYVGDVARANLLALDRADGEAINISTGRAVKTRELLAAICRVMGRELAYTRGEARPGDLRESCLDNSRAATVLGWTPAVDLEAGLEKTVVSFRSHA